MPVTELVFSDLKQDASLVEEREKALPEAFQWFTTIESAVSAHTGLILHHNNTDVSNARNRCIAIEWKSVDDFKEAIGRESFQGFKDKLIPYIAAFPTPQLFSADIRSINVLEAPFVGVLKVKPSNGIEECRKAWVELKTAIRGASMSVQFHNATGTGVGCDEDDFVGLIGWKSLEEGNHVTGEAAVKDALNRFLATGEASTYVVELDTTYSKK